MQTRQHSAEVRHSVR